MLAGIAVAGSMLAASVTSVAFVADAAAAPPPPQRAYELVSPADKSASDIAAGIQATAAGDRVAYVSWGTLANSPVADFGTFYRADRGPSGWSTTTMSPLQTMPDRTSLASSVNPQDFSADLSTFYSVPFGTGAPLVPEDTNDSVDVYASTAGGAARWLSPSMDPTAHGDAVYAGRSADGRTIVFESNRQFLPDVPGDPGDDDPNGGPPRIRQVYELVDGVAHIVSLVDDGSGHDVPAPDGARFGSGHTMFSATTPPDRTAISDDGSHIFFQADGQLYVRIDGTRTVLVSASQVTGSVGDPAPTGAMFAGAATDGHYVTFTSPDPLVDGATGGGLYGYDLGSDRLTLLAETPMTQPAGTVKTAPDGSRVYFVTYNELDGEGTDFEENLWVARADGARHFVGTLDQYADSAITLGYGENQSLAAITPDGTRLAFQSAANLGRYDSGGVSEVYIYDDAAQRITCASCPPGGADPAGPATLRDPTNNFGSIPRSFTTAGDLFFETPERLSDDDTDDQTDVYGYTGGRAVLMTPGTSTVAHYVDNSADGSSLFFRTRDGLVRADHDGGYMDLYVARVGGGFPDAAPPMACACRPAPSPDPGPPAAPPTVFALDTTPGSAPVARTTFSVGAVSAASRSAFARTGRLALKVRVSDAAVVTAGGRAQLGRKRVTVATGSVNKLAAGSATLTVRLTSAARRALARSGRLTIRLTVACSDTTRTAHATLVLHHAKTKTTKKGR